MGEKAITELKGQHVGHDIHVLASGPSAGHIDESYFNNKIVIGVNEVWLRFANLDFLVRKESARSQAAYSTGIPMIVSKYNCGSHQGALNQFYGDSDYYVFDHQHNQLTDLDLDVIGTDKIVVSYSTITSAMHVAAYMGASNIILVGHDCGLLDGQARMQGLPGAIAGEDFYLRFLAQIEPQTRLVRERINQVYGCNIYSLNPFINFGLEGHIYEVLGAS